MHKIKENSILASVIIPTYGSRLDYLEDAIASVQAQELQNGFEIIVVDNSFDGVIRSMVDTVKKNNSSNKKQITYVHEPKMGLINARHAGARKASGEVLVYIDDDVITPEGWLNAMLEPFMDQDVACVGGKILPKWEAEVPDWFSNFNKGYLSLLDLGDNRKEVKNATLWGCNLAVRRSLLFSLGGFHPDGVGERKLIWFRGNGECGLEKKILDIGFKLIYEPEAWLYHRIPESRLKPEYFFWRFLTQGIDDSYEYQRGLRKSRKNLYYLRLIKEIVLSYLRATKTLCKLILRKGNVIKLRAEIQYWHGKSQHLIRSIISPRLRKHIFRNIYL